MKPPISDFWSRPATIERNNFVNKSLSCWALNIAVGCSHACRFCYVPGVSTGKGPIAAKIRAHGVADPDEDWGSYVFLRQWDEKAFLRSLAEAERTPPEKLNADGNRAVMLCTTTDPYMTIRNADPEKQRKLNGDRLRMVRRALELIRDRSTLNVRILTRSPLAELDFPLMKSFGNRLLFGVSLPTMRDDLAKVYEAKAPGPKARLKLLEKAKAWGIPLYVAMAPTFPECETADLANTLKTIRDLDPVTVFHEPINIRAENVERIKRQAFEMGVEVRSNVFDSQESWAIYARSQLYLVNDLAHELGLSDRLHLWPDKALKKYIHADWLSVCWNRVSEWPKEVRA